MKWMMMVVTVITTVMAKTAVATAMTTTDAPIRTKRLDMTIIFETIKEAHLTYAAISNSRNLHSTISAKLQNYTDLKEEFVRIW
jgi:hypothetical protein